LKQLRKKLIDVDGIRTSKMVNGVTTQFNTVDGRITSTYNGTDLIYFTYDSNEHLSSITGSMAGSVGAKNPMRYRGYYYDAETGYYYLQSRYYDPGIGRFINADEPCVVALGSSIGTNSFAYCKNNPVSTEDSSGHLAANVVSGILGMIIGATTNLVGQGFSYFLQHGYKLSGLKQHINWKSVALSGAIGLASGLLLVSRFSKTVSIAANATLTAVSDIADSLINHTKINIGYLLGDITLSILIGSLGGDGGLGEAFYKKSIFIKGGAYFYPGTETSTTSLQLTRPILKKFAKEFGKYIRLSFGDMLVRSVRL
jgi:RHS repeat-associated protein